MTTITSPIAKINSKESGNGKPVDSKIAIVPTAAEAKKDLKPEEVKPAVSEPIISKKEMTMIEKIMKVENLQLIVDKRAKLVQTRSELERFQVSSNDFNCSLKMNDSDGNTFSTSFTPGIKKVIDFLKASFEASIVEVENKIIF